MKSDEQIKTILETGMRYACFKLSLNKNRKKGGYDSYTYKKLIDLLEDEVVELNEAVADLLKYIPNTEITPSDLLEKVAKECGDVIALASFIAQKTEMHGI